MGKLILSIDGFKVDKAFYEQWTNDLRWLDELLNEGTHSEMLDKQERGEKFDHVRKNNPVRAVAFNRRKIATQIVASKDIVSDMKFESGLDADNFIKDELTHQVSAYIYDRMLHEQRIVREFNAPTFTDWLFRRKRRFSFVVKAYEVLKGVKRIDSTEIIYLIEPENDNRKT